MVQRQKTLNPVAQIVSEKVSLMRTMPQGCILKQTSLSFEWETEIQPTPLSQVYKIKISYRYGEVPKVYVTEPYPLDKYPGKEVLPHVYSTSEQRICLYYPGIGEWTKKMLIARTIVPWAAEWLQFYELWLANGEWLGEGLHSQNGMEKKEK